jgi:DNA-directed RNA polymerase specialized sigma24 family protein
MGIDDYDEDKIITAITLNEAIDRLPEKQRVVIRMKMNGLTLKECGEQLGMTSAAAGFIYRQAIVDLRNVIAAMDKENDAIDQLPEKQRIVLRMKMNGIALKEIREKLGMTPEVVWVTYKQAKKNLRSILIKMEGEDDRTA